MVNARSTLHRPKIRSGHLPRCRFQCFRSCSSWPQVPRPQPGQQDYVSVCARWFQSLLNVDRNLVLSTGGSDCSPRSEDSNLLKPASASSEMTHVLASSTWWCSGYHTFHATVNGTPFAWTHVSPYFLRWCFSSAHCPAVLPRMAQPLGESLSSTPSSAPHKGMKDHSIIGAGSG